MELNSGKKLEIVILILIIILFCLIVIDSKSDDECLNLQLITKSYSQNRDEASYFLLLEPDNLGNLKITVDVIDYNQNSSRIFSIIQPEQKKYVIENGTKKYDAFYPNLAYVYYSNKIYPISSNIDETFHIYGTISATIDEDGFKGTKISKQKYDLSLPDEIGENISDFSLLIFTKDENFESNLEKYPFDDIKTVVVFDFPNRTNINILVDIPNEFNSYTIEPFIFEENKEISEEKLIELKEIYNGIFKISSTNKVDHEKNYSRIEINIKRNITSIETISFCLIILIFILMSFFYYKNKINFKEFIPIYIGLNSVPFAIYLNNRPSIKGFTTIEIIVVCIILLLLTYNVLKSKN
jgi:hypothetical protein